MGKEGAVRVLPGAAERFLHKAQEFGRQMEAALSAGDHNAAASAASPCVISACDAVLARERGVRSRARDHGAVVGLIAALSLPGVAERTAQVEGGLALKHVAEYDDRDVTKAEAALAVKRARRVVDWVEALLGSPR